MYISPLSSFLEEVLYKSLNEYLHMVTVYYYLFVNVLKLQAGLSTLLNALKLYDASYHSLGVHFRPVCLVSLLLFCLFCALKVSERKVSDQKDLILDI